MRARNMAGFTDLRAERQAIAGLIEAPGPAGNAPSRCSDVAIGALNVPIQLLRDDVLKQRVRVLLDVDRSRRAGPSRPDAGGTPRRRMCAKPAALSPASPPPAPA